MVHETDESKFQPLNSNKNVYLQFFTSNIHNIRRVNPFFVEFIFYPSSNELMKCRVNITNARKFLIAIHTHSITNDICELHLPTSPLSGSVMFSVAYMTGKRTKNDE